LVEGEPEGTTAVEGCGERCCTKLYRREEREWEWN